jgi:hypothetical protein
LPIPVPLREIAAIATRSSTLVLVAIGPKVSPLRRPVTSEKGKSVVNAGGDVIFSRARKNKLQCGKDPAVDIEASPWSEQKAEKEPKGGNIGVRWVGS